MKKHLTVAKALFKKIRTIFEYLFGILVAIIFFLIICLGMSDLGQWLKGLMGL